MGRLAFLQAKLLNRREDDLATFRLRSERTAFDVFSVSNRRRREECAATNWSWELVVWRSVPVNRIDRRPGFSSSGIAA